MPAILIVEDKASLGRMLQETLRAEGYTVRLASNGEDAMAALGQEDVDLVLTDLMLPGAGGIEVLGASKSQDPARPVIVMTAHGSVDVAVEAMKKGAFDFIAKPFDIDHLLVLMRRALDNSRLLNENLLLKEQLRSRHKVASIIGKSAAMMKVAGEIGRVAPATTSVLILGESGTGKELFARAVHDMSPRRQGPFVTVNCAAIPEGLLESELFGHERGAFSGAEARKPGKFELAGGGTVFLDEIGELDLRLQAKLLRFLQDGVVERVGGTRPLALDVRVVAASNRDLEAEVGRGGFREDLYYRLSVFPVRLPPLRERQGDIPLLVEHFIGKYAVELNSGVRSISPEALSILEAHRWKGNVRELENAIERAIILCDSDTIGPEQVRPFGAARPADFLGDIDMCGPLESAVRAAVRVVETRRISDALLVAGGNKTRAAAALGVSYKTLLTKIKDYGIG